jgi:phage terminase large subunit-like protein
MPKEAILSQEEYTLRLTLELERRKRADPMAFYEPASNKVLDFHKSRAMTRALFGANRSSKTESSIQEVLWHIRGDHPYQPVPVPPVYWRIVVPDFNQVEKVINDKFQRMCPPSLMMDGKWEKTYNTRSHIITFKNGSKADIMTHEQPIASFEGSSRNGTLFDEEAPHDVYTSCIMRHVDVRGKTIMAMTPLNGLTYTYDDIYLKSFTNPNIETWTLSIYENKYLTQEAIKEIEELITDEIDREIRLYGKFRSRTGMVFGGFDPQIHIYNPEDYYDAWDGEYPPRHWMHFVGIDPGWDHPTGVVWIAVHPDTGEHYTYREFRKSGMYPDEIAEIIFSYNREMGIFDPIYVIDSQAAATSSNGSRLIDDYRTEDIYPVLGTKKLFDGNLWLARLLKVVEGRRGDMHTKMHISTMCPELVQEIGKYQRAAPTTMNNTERFIDKENDLIAAWRYASWEAKKWEYDTYVAMLEQIKKQLKKPHPLGKEREEKDKNRKGFKRTGY